MFEPRNCVKGAALVFVLAGLRFHSVVAGLVFAAVPLAFALRGLLRR